MNPLDILNFWYTPPMSEHWFSSTPEIDAEIREKFESVWEKAAEGKLDAWKETAEGCLALCIVLDQFPLNMFRGEAKSFSTEQQAVAVCKYAVEKGLDQQLPIERRTFLYMPLMHSEHLADQDESVRLFEASKLENNIKFAHHHREIVRQYGRFPHRNAILGRGSTQAEIDYLNSPQAFTG
ncbi:DUF924 family protein [Thiomicrorhabdus heinhorstiae]|uniref:DUF924 domain-containing protein n=1 Tax=Thiomicrorhabdus heinhorstiae TaxID=2748010 RepID=A0ABS0BXL5_9GAMM|nr:DUF924 family protein [Thiomicrorhabdus heinhorstiae]MBF6057749.1 DUF924 domain-containing protein [Thiomicrorhabdus heinhorstiae]